MKPSSPLLLAVLSFLLSCTQSQRGSTGAAFAVVGFPVVIAGVQGLQGSTADNNSNDGAVAVLVGGLAMVALGAILFADSKKTR